MLPKQTETRSWSKLRDTSNYYENNIEQKLTLFAIIKHNSKMYVLSPLVAVYITNTNKREMGKFT